MSDNTAQIEEALRVLSSGSEVMKELITQHGPKKDSS